MRLAALVAASTILLTPASSTLTEVRVTHQAPEHITAIHPTATIAQLNAFLASVPGDGGASVKLPSGKVLWLFGDTLDAQGGRNTSAIQSGATFTRRAGELKATTTSNWYWPGAVAVDGGQVVVIWAKMTSTGSGGFDFAQVGTVASTYNATSLALVSETSSSLTSATSSVVKVGTSWHVYGTKPSGGGKAVLHWSVPVGSLGALSAWSAASQVAPASWGAGTDVAARATGSSVQFWTKHLDIMSADIVTGTASTPTGAWSAAVVQSTPNVPAGAWSYAVHVHPEQATPCLTYAINGGPAGANHLYAAGL